MAKPPFDHDPLERLLHLDDEEIVLCVGARPGAEDLQAHAEACPACALRVERARGLLQIEPFQRRADPRRIARLMDRLTAVGAVPAASGRAAFVRVAFHQGALRVLSTDTEVRIGRAVATRSVDPLGASPGATFFRQIGGAEVELHLVHIPGGVLHTHGGAVDTPGGAFHLVVGVNGKDSSAQWRVALHRQHRELAAQPAPHGTATFKSLRPAAYRLEIQDRGVTVGFVEIDVEAHDEPEVSR